MILLATLPCVDSVTAFLVMFVHSFIFVAVLPCSGAVAVHVVVKPASNVLAVVVGKDVFTLNGG